MPPVDNRILSLSVVDAIRTFTEKENEISLTLSHGGDAVVTYEFTSFQDVNDFLTGIASRQISSEVREVWWLTRSQHKDGPLNES